MSQPTDIDQAAFQLQEAKNRMELVRQDVLNAEQTIIALAGVKDEGTTTQSGKYFKIKTVGKVTRRIDFDALDLLKQKMPEAILSKVFAYKPTIDVKALRHIELNEPEYYNEISRAVIAKPAKVAVTVELVEDAA
jgi:hypothetical protein|tara:strand:- start:349 stop:753 length:405 start_codon:yes stop_codon:yes gene_type:complete